jgi:hypothetical protein
VKGGNPGSAPAAASPPRQPNGNAGVRFALPETPLRAWRRSGAAEPPEAGAKLLIRLVGQADRVGLVECRKSSGRHAAARRP